MNVIEKYVKEIQQLNLDTDLFEPSGTEICPAEGTRHLIDFAIGCKSWFSHVDHIDCTQLICKTWKNSQGIEELQGVAAFNTYYKVKTGEAKVSAIQVLYANDSGKITYINSFWDLSNFQKLTVDHPELAQVFKK